MLGTTSISASIIFGKAGNCTELLGALLGAAALENGEPSSSASVTPVALFRALELLGDPLRSKARSGSCRNASGNKA